QMCIRDRYRSSEIWRDFLVMDLICGALLCALCLFCFMGIKVRWRGTGLYRGTGSKLAKVSY
ncbi:MAG: hypothetical protein IAA16_01480, partial [Candidatus Treponema excrementipullorum]|nr:hypothetical protein [Candidatus Treponema excrementipullorum]